jgi:hypothetical protein
MAQDTNIRRVLREINVLRSVVEGLTALFTANTEERKRPPTVYENPNDPALTTFRIERIPLDKLSWFIGVLHTALAANSIGVMLDNIGFKPVSGDPREHSLKRTMYLNVVLCTWTRENLYKLLKTACPDDKYRNVNLLVAPFDPETPKSPSILDRLEADAEIMRFEGPNVSIEEDEERSRRTVRKGPKMRAPLISVDQARGILENLHMGDTGKALLPALGCVKKIFDKKTEANHEEG